MELPQSERLTTAYPIPIHITESYFLSAKGAFIAKAVLTASSNGVPITLGIIKPVYDVPEDEQPHTEPPSVDLKFFGDMPIHGGLMRGASCTLYTMDGRIPSVVFAIVDNSLTWDKVGQIGGVCAHTETIEAMADQGPTKRTIYYSREQIGFMPA